MLLLTKISSSSESESIFLARRLRAAFFLFFFEMALVLVTSVGLGPFDAALLAAAFRCANNSPILGRFRFGFLSPADARASAAANIAPILFDLDAVLDFPAPVEFDLLIFFCGAGLSRCKIDEVGAGVLRTTAGCTLGCLSLIHI